MGQATGGSVDLTELAKSVGATPFTPPQPLDLSALAHDVGATPYQASAPADLTALAKAVGATPYTATQPVDLATLARQTGATPMQADGVTDPASVHVFPAPGKIEPGSQLVDLYRSAKASLLRLKDTVLGPLLPESFVTRSVSAMDELERSGRRRPAAPARGGEDQPETPADPVGDAITVGFVRGSTEASAQMARGMSSPLNIGLTALGIGEGVIIKRIAATAADIPRIEEALVAAKELKATGQLKDLSYELVDSVQRLRDLERIRVATRAAQAVTGAAFTVEGAANIIKAPTWSEKAFAVAQAAGGAAMAITGTAGAREAARNAEEAGGFVAGAREAIGGPSPTPAAEPQPSDIVVQPERVALPAPPTESGFSRTVTPPVTPTPAPEPPAMREIVLQQPTQAPQTPAATPLPIPGPPPPHPAPAAPTSTSSPEAPPSPVPVGSAPSTAEPPRETPTLTARRFKNLSDEDKTVQEKAATALEADVDGFVDRYRQRFGTVINADNASELFEDYAKSPETRAKYVTAVRGPAGTLVDELYRRALAEPVPEGKKPLVVFTSGGNASGKSTNLADVGDASLVFDSTLTLKGPSKAKIDEALAAGRDVVVRHVAREPIDALVHGALPRAMQEGEGRTVPLRVLARTHRDAARVFLELADEYKANPAVEFRAYENREGQGLAPLTLDALRAREYPEGDVLTGRLKDALDAEYRAGRVSDVVYRGTAHTEPPRVEGGHRRDGGADGGTVPPEIRPQADADVTPAPAARNGSDDLVYHGTNADLSHIAAGSYFGTKNEAAMWAQLRAKQNGGTPRVYAVKRSEIETAPREVLPEGGYRSGQQFPAVDVTHNAIAPAAPTPSRGDADAAVGRFADAGSPRAAALPAPVADQPTTIRAYHGSNVDFDKFELRPTYRNVEGAAVEVTPAAFFFATDRSSAKRFAKDRSLIAERLRGTAPGTPKVRAFDLRVEQPFDFTITSDVRQQMASDGYSTFYNPDAPSPYALDDFENLTGVAVDDWNDVQAALDDPDVIESLRDAGYDGARLLETDGTETWAVFDADQINPVEPKKGLTGARSSRSDANVGVFTETEEATSGRLPPQRPSSPEFAQPIEFPELVDLARELTGTPGVVKGFRTAGKLGEFRGVTGQIRLSAELFKKGEEHQLAAALAHEIGHLIDWLPHRTLKRGNLLGRLYSLRTFTKHTFSAPDGTTVKNADVKAELVRLSAFWRPWDRDTADAGFIRYRDSSRELYADAISVLLNNPGLLEQQAPTFWKQFFDALDKKPAVKDAYFDLIERLSGTREDLVARRRAGVRRMFEAGDVTALDLIRRQIAERRQSLKDLWYRLKLQLVDRNYAVIDRLTTLAKRGVVLPADENPLYLLEERNYMGGKLKGFAERHFAPVYRAVSDADIAWNAFGEALFYERIIAGDRSETANPRGISPKDAAELYDSLKRELGTERTEVLTAQMDTFRQAVKDVAEDAYKAGLYTDELHAQMAANPKYVSFQVIEHLESGVTSRVYRQVGTLKDIVNPADATILKTLVTIRAIEHNKVKAGNLQFLEQHFPGDIEKARTVWSGKGPRPVESRDQNQKLITYYEHGKLVGRYVDPYVADMLEKAAIGQNLAAVDILRKLNSGWLRPVFTTFNLGFQGYNFAKDFQRFWKNVPGMTLRRALQRYWQALPMARIRAFGMPKAPTAADIAAYGDLLDAEESKILSVTFNELMHGREIEDTQIEDILSRLDVAGFHQPKRARFAKPFLAVLDAIGDLGDFIETLPKGAGILELKGAGTVKALAADQRSFIRRKVGSPDFLAGGSAKPIFNEVLLFSNAIVQAWRSDFEVATQPKTRAGFWYKTAAANILPKLLMWAALAGLAGEEVRRLYQRITEYDRTNYIPIPFGEDAGKVVYFRMPQDDTGRIIGGLVWKMLLGMKGDAELYDTVRDVVDYTAGQAPGVNPALSTVGSALDMVAGRNPRDNFRGRDLLTDDEQKAGGWPAWKKFLGWEFQNMGGGIVFKFYPGEPRPTRESAGQKFLELPIISNIVGRFVRITDYGDTEALRTARARAEQDEARERVDEKSAVYDAVRTFQTLPRTQQTPQRVTALARDLTATLYADDPREAVRRFPQIQERLRTSVVRGEADPFLDAFMSAQSTKQKQAVVQEWLKRRPAAGVGATQ